MISYPENSPSVPIEWLKFLNFGGLAWEKRPIAATPVFSLFYVVLIPTYFENLGHLQLERFKSSNFLNACLRKILQHFTPEFRRSPVLCDIYSTIDRNLISLSFRFKSKMKKRNNKNETNKEKKEKKKSSLKEHKQKKGGL